MAEIKLTRQQQAVVDNRGGSLLVSAAAGSGKTKVLIDRVLKRVSEENANVDDFLMITFTQAAAAELRGKLIAQLSEKLAEDPSNRHLQTQLNRVYLAQISTVHAFCMSLLRDYAHELRLPADFRLCDEREGLQLSQKAMLRCMDEAYATDETDPEIHAALDMLGAGRSDAVLESLISKLYDNLQCYRDPSRRAQDLRASVCVEEGADAGRTLWGEYMIGEFRHFIDGMEKQFVLLAEKAAKWGVDTYLPALESNLQAIAALRELRTWQELQQAKPDFGRLSTKKTDADPRLKEAIRNRRSKLNDEIKKRLKKFSMSSEEVLEDLRINRSAVIGLIRLTERYASLFANEKKRRHVLDYNDLEHEALRLVLGEGHSPTRAAREISQRYREIMVDEYQDTNAVQDALFYAISREGENLFFVGDIKQSIYRFRMADPTIFREKYLRFVDYEKAQAHEPRKVLLSDNFRSHPAVLEAANAVFRLTMTDRVGGLYYTDAEALRANQEPPDMGTPAVELHCIDATTEEDLGRTEIEAEFVARRISNMLHNGELIPDGKELRPVRASDIVLLFRAMKGKTESYLDALQRYGIHGICTDNNIYESEEIRVLTALLQVIDNPRQDIPLLTVLLSPLFRFPTGELAKLRGKDRKGEIYDLLLQSSAAEDFLQKLSRLRDLSQQMSIRSLLDEIDTVLYVRAIFGAMDGGVQRVRNIDRFYAVADGYERGDRVGLSGFLRYLELAKQRPVSAEQPAGGDAVRLMTVHASKGLEFPVVFLVDLCRKFNFRSTTSRVITDPLLGIGADVYDSELRMGYPSLPKNAISDHIRQDSLSEEMRILYVAMTRAKYRMIMSCCAAGLERRIVELGQSLSIPLAESVTENVTSMGDWIMLAALTRTEAGELFRLCEASEYSSVSGHPWKICYHEGITFLPEQIKEEHEKASVSPEALPFLFTPYEHTAASMMPAKLTATQMKSDHGGQGNEAEQIYLRQPSFGTEDELLTGARRGTAIHLAMQYIDYGCCGSEEEIRGELLRLRQKRYLTPQQAASVSVEKLLRFFRSELFHRIRSAERVVREFKFTLLEDAAIYDPSLKGETVMLQGVTDCCIVEEGGLVILDFKSDHISPGGEALRAEHYRGQLDAYSRALSRIFDLPIKDRFLYFFATDTAYSL